VGTLHDKAPAPAIEKENDNDNNSPSRRGKHLSELYDPLSPLSLMLVLTIYAIGKTETFLLFSIAILQDTTFDELPNRPLDILLNAPELEGAFSMRTGRLPT
jgi:hypothetical protein